MTKKAILMGTLLIFFSCHAAKKTVSQDSVKLIAKGALHGAGQEGIEAGEKIITAQKEWEQLQAKMDAVNLVSKQFKNTPVDFSKEMVLVIFDKVRGSGGYVIRISEIKETKKQLLVKIQEKKPHGMATSVMEQPFYVVKIAKTNKKIIFQLED